MPDVPIPRTMDPKVLRTPQDARCRLYHRGHCVHWIQAKKSEEQPEQAVVISAVDGNEIWYFMEENPGRAQRAKTHSAECLGRLLSARPNGVEGALRPYHVMRVGDLLISLCRGGDGWVECGDGRSLT